MTYEASSGSGRVFTFYSYKGGTGRSMALANIACLLAQQGGRSPGERPILMIDWDLEAPGLHRYFPSSTTLSDRSGEVEHHPGLIDYFLALEDRLSSRGALSEDERITCFDAVPLAEYTLDTGIQGLHILKAGSFDGAYPERINRFGWQDLYRRYPWLFAAFAAYLASKYRYVLIDSRTGLSDTSGICTMLMPEKLVVVFTPNRQSLAGISDLVRRAVDYRKGSDDLRPLSVFPLPSRIEATEPALRTLWRLGDVHQKIEGYQPLFEGIIRETYSLESCSLQSYFDEVQIQHVPRFSYGEEIAVFVESSRDRLSMVESYTRFCDRLTTFPGPWEEPIPLSLAASPEFDVFISYNVSDRPLVERIVGMLQATGIRTWWDREQLRPGVEWQSASERGLAASRIAVVFIGSTLGSWQATEVGSLIQSHLSRGLQVIPVLLPGSGDIPPEVGFLGRYIWVQFTSPEDQEAVHQLLDGIRGLLSQGSGPVR